jgi:F-type H+-transporting ATPase subunit b
MIAIRFLASDAPFTSEDFYNKLFPNGWSFLINFLALIVLFVALYFLAYKPVHRNIQARKDYIEHNLRDSERAKAVNEAKEKEAASIIAEAKKEGAVIIDKAKSDATVKANEITAQAQSEAAARQKAADAAIAQAEAASQERVHEAIVQVALDASKKVLEREVSSEDNKRLVGQFVDDVANKKKEQ